MGPADPSRWRAIAERSADLADQKHRADPTGVGMIETLYALTVSEISRLGAKDRACRKGCSYCCHRVVLCSIAEVARVARYVRERFSDEDRAHLLERLETYEREVAPHFGRGLTTLRPACPLLVEDKCTVYEARPFFCRGLNSKDAQACKQFRDYPDRKVSIPVVNGQMQTVHAIAMGLEHCLAKNGLIAGPHDFARALKIALERPEAIEDWLSGGQSFEAAHRQRQDQAEPPPNKPPVHPKYGPADEPTGHFDQNGLKLFDYFMARGDHRSARAAIQPSHPGYRLAWIRVPMGYASEDQILESRAEFQRAIREFADSPFDPKEAFDGLTVFRMLDLSYQGLNDRDLLAEVGDLVCNRIAAKALSNLTQPIEGPRPSGPIRIGYAGCDLKASSLSPWTLGWLKHHSKDFETFAIHLGEDEDDVSAEFQRLAGHYYHLPRRRPVPEDARTIKELNLDVLVHLDSGTRSRSSQLATLRLARVQCAAWGAPETTGFPTIDYYLSSEMMEPPDGDDHYTEKLIRLPRSGVCYLREAGAVSTLQKSDFGIDGPLIVCVQPSSKFHPAWDHLYRSINEATGQPIVFVDRSTPDRQIVADRMAKAGVRAKYLPHLSGSDYRGLLAAADAVLDTPGWNGGITTVHALDLGRPVITLRMGLKRGRQSACFLELANAAELIARDEQDYVDLATNSERRHEAARELSPNGIYEDIGAVRAFEEFIRSVTLS